MADWFNAYFKVGDQPGITGYPDGLLAGYSDPDVYNPVLSDRTKFTFSTIKLLKSVFLQTVKDALSPNEDLSDGTQPTEAYRKTGKLITFSELEVATGIAGLESDLREKEKVVEVIDGTGLDISILKSSDTLNPPAEDLNAISSGSHTIGSGGDYALWSLFFADVTDLTGDITGTQISNVTETSSSANVTIDMNGNNFTVTSNSNPRGVFADGNIITYTNAGGWLSFFNSTNVGIIDIGLLNMNWTAPSNGKMFTWVNVSGITINLKYHDILFHGNNNFNSCIEINDSSPIDIWNVKARNSISGDAVNWRSAGASGSVENVIADRMGSCVRFGNPSILGPNGGVNNCVGINSTVGAFVNHAAALGQNNADDDGTCADVNWGTGTNNNPNITPSEQFESLVSTNFQYLRPKARAIVANDGLTPTISENIAGIEGNIRPHTGGVSIGAHEFPFPEAEATTVNKAIQITIA